MEATSGLYKALNMWAMKVKIIGDPVTPAYRRAEDLLAEMDIDVVPEAGQADLAIAPLLTEILPLCEILKPKYGTLIFHPSPLPYGRGASAIKWAFKRGEPISAATWFWADAGIDTGPICEQEIIRIDHSIRPRDFYELHVLPAMARTLKRCLNNLKKGYKRAVEQSHEHATYDPRI